MKTRLLLLLIVFVAMPFLLNAPQNSVARTYQAHPYNQTFYVRPPGAQYGTGDGSDWENAFSDLPEDLVRGAKYYLASGIYNTGASDAYHIFEDPELDDLYIGVFKATVDDHGTDDTGWNDSFGEGGAQLGPLHFVTGYYEIDGQFGVRDQEHGFKLYVETCTQQQKAVYFPWNSESSYIELRHIDMGLCGPTSTPYTPQDVIYSVYSIDNIIISDCYIHDANRIFIMMIEWSNVLVENNYFARCGKHLESHPLGIRAASNVTIRNNVFQDAINAYINLESPNGVYIYSNIFKRTSNEDWSIYAIINNFEIATDVFIYNNTFYNLKGLAAGIRFSESLPHVNVQVYNNLWAKTEANQIQLFGAHDYNAFYDNWRVDENGDPVYSLDQRMFDENAEENMQVITENPFVAPDNGDFRLAFATEPGLVLPAPYDRDPDENIRGDDGTWDRGAFEFMPSLTLHGAAADRAINLTWTVNTHLPATTTWQIDYFTIPTSVLSVTDPYSTTRSYHLSDLINGEWYTVTLNAMVDTTVLFSDTVRVMPTDILNYLPFVLREVER